MLRWFESNGVCPTPSGTRVDVKINGDVVGNCSAMGWAWTDPNLTHWRYADITQTPDYRKWHGFDDWVPWNGGVPSERLESATVAVVCRDGRFSGSPYTDDTSGYTPVPGRNWSWGHQDAGNDIIAYRIHRKGDTPVPRDRAPTPKKENPMADTDDKTYSDATKDRMKELFSNSKEMAKAGAAYGAVDDLLEAQIKKYELMIPLLPDNLKWVVSTEARVALIYATGMLMQAIPGAEDNTYANVARGIGSYAALGAAAKGGETMGRVIMPIARNLLGDLVDSMKGMGVEVDKKGGLHLMDGGDPNSLGDPLAGKLREPVTAQEVSR